MAKTAVKVGVIGCGNISLVYIPNLQNKYKTVDVKAVADMNVEAAKKSAADNNIPCVYTVDEMLADPEIELIVNLTNPVVHYELNKKALEAGKHVYCEKPLALDTDQAKELVQIADSKGLMVASAPDTILGAGLMTCRKLLDEGAIGRVTGFTANLCQHGNELWHPNPGFFYKVGGGPMLDMGPYYVAALVALLGPIKEIYCKCTCPTPVREIKGEMMQVEVPTTYNAVFEFANGATGNVRASFDMWQSKLPDLEFYGDDGALYGPNPNFFGGPVSVFDGKSLEEQVKGIEGFFPKLMALVGPNKDQYLKEVELPYPAAEDPHTNLRGIGVADMCSALLNNRKPRLKGDFACHVVEALTACQKSSEAGKPYVMTTTCERPEIMPLGLELWEVE
jgi:predicted dehydrogenase